MTNTNKLLADFNRYFTSGNDVDVPERVSVPRDEWRELHAALAQPAQPSHAVAAIRARLAQEDGQVPKRSDKQDDDFASGLRSGLRIALEMLSTPTAAPTPSQAAPCQGMNCGCTDGVSHSLECQAEHAAAIAGGTFVKQQAAVTELVDGKWYWVRYEGFGKTYEAPALFKSDAEAFYSHEFSGVPAREVHIIGETLAAYAKKAGA